MQGSWIGNIFSQIGSMSIKAGVIICVIFGIRLCLRRAPKLFCYLLWSVVLFRLFCPVAVSSPFSVLRIWNPTMQTVGQAAFSQAARRQMHTITPLAPADTALESDSSDLPVGAYEKAESASDARSDWRSFVNQVCGIVWLTGLMCMAGYGLIGTLRLKRRLKDAVCIGENIYISDHIDTPFAMGIFVPRIYLPGFLSGRKKQFILLHEQTHIRRGDPLWKPLAFGEGSVKCRIQNVMRYQKPAAAAVCAAVLLVIGCLVGCGTNPGSERPDDRNYVRSGTEVVDSAQAETGASAADPALAEAAETWARAYCTRNGEVIADMSAPSVREALKDAELLDGTDGSYIFGMSSPWPQSEEDFLLVGISGTQAEILYYAKTSDPHISVWSERITLSAEENGYMVTEEQMEHLDAIRSVKEWKRAYPYGIRNTPMDYTQDNLAERLHQSALLSSSWLWRELSDPEKAAIKLLNLSEQDVEASVGEVKDGHTSVTLRFADGTVTVSMVQPFPADSTDGKAIWIPQDYAEGGLNGAAQKDVSTCGQRPDRARPKGRPGLSAA